MWPFSDADVDEVENSVQYELPLWTEAQKKDFLNGFIDAWKRGKDLRQSMAADEILKILKKTPDSDAKNFGRALGYLIATFEAPEPEHLLQGGPSAYNTLQYFSLCVKALRGKTHFYEIIIKRIKRWEKRLKKRIESRKFTEQQHTFGLQDGKFTPEEEKNYRIFMEMLGI